MNFGESGLSQAGYESQGNMASTIRTFIAVELTPEQRRALSQLVRQLARDWPQYRWVDPDQMHLTLNFLGNVRDENIATVCEHVRDVAGQHLSFDISLAELGAFPKKTRPRVLWAGVDQNGSALSKIHYQVADALDEVCREQDRKRFHPHVTLGRIRRHERWPDGIISMLENAPPLDLPPLEISQLTVFASHLETTGPVYTVMDRAELG